MNVARKVLLKPTKKQIQQLQQQCSTLRYLQNGLLEYRIRYWDWLCAKHGEWRVSKETRNAFYKEFNEVCGFFSDCKQITALLNSEAQWVSYAKGIPRDAMNIVAETVDNSWKAWMKLKERGKPRYKSAKDSQSITLQFTGKEKYIIDYEKRELHLKKLGTFKFRDEFMCKHKGIKNTSNAVIKRITILNDRTGNWYASILFSADVVVETQPAVHPVVGMDVGYSPHFAVLSSGEYIDMPEEYVAIEKKIRGFQQKLSRQLRISNPECFDENGAIIKGKRMTISNRAKETKRSIAKLHQEITDKRKLFNYDTVKSLINTYDGFVVEDLQIKTMMENPIFAKGIAMASWGKFMEVLERKSLQHNRSFEKVNPAMTTRTCSQCQHEMIHPISAIKWLCPNCKAKHHRKYNASLNIVARATTSEEKQ